MAACVEQLAREMRTASLPAACGDARREAERCGAMRSTPAAAPSSEFESKRAFANGFADSAENEKHSEGAVALSPSLSTQPTAALEDDEDEEGADEGTADEDDEGTDEAANESAADGDNDDADGDVDDSMQVDVAVSKVLRHYVYRGARAGSLYNVYAKLLFEDGSCSMGGVEPVEPLAKSESGREALRAYVKTKKGAKIAKYLPLDL